MLGLTRLYLRQRFTGSIQGRQWDFCGLLSFSGQRKPSWFLNIIWIQWSIKNSTRKIVMTQYIDWYKRTGNHFFRIFEVGVERFLIPDDSRISVGVSVGVAINLAGLTSPESEKVGSLKVFATFIVSMTLSALLNKDFFTFRDRHSLKKFKSEVCAKNSMWQF